MTTAIIRHHSDCAPGARNAIAMPVVKEKLQILNATALKPWKTDHTSHQASEVLEKGDVYANISIYPSPIWEISDNICQQIERRGQMPHFYSAEGLSLEEDLDEPSMRKLSGIGKSRLFRQGEHLYRQGDPAEEIFVLMSGSVKATSIDTNGFESLIKIHGTGSLLGLSALRPMGFRDANGVAVGEVYTNCLPSKAFLSLLQEDSTLALLLIRTLLKRQQQLHGRIRAILSKSVEQRLAHALLQLSAEATARPDGSPLRDIMITHEDLAALVLSRRQYVTQIMRDFVAKRLIASARKRVCVIDPDGLRRIADT